MRSKRRLAGERVVAKTSYIVKASIVCGEVFTRVPILVMLGEKDNSFGTRRPQLRFNCLLQGMDGRQDAQALMAFSLCRSALSAPARQSRQSALLANRRC